MPYWILAVRAKTQQAMMFSDPAKLCKLYAESSDEVKSMLDIDASAAREALLMEFEGAVFGLLRQPGKEQERDIRAWMSALSEASKLPDFVAANHSEALGLLASLVGYKTQETTKTQTHSRFSFSRTIRPGSRTTHCRVEKRDSLRTRLHNKNRRSKRSSAFWAS